MKRKNHSLKSVYREIMTEQKVKIETEEAVYDYDFPDDADFEEIRFSNKSKIYPNKWMHIRGVNRVNTIHKFDKGKATYSRKKVIAGTDDAINNVIGDLDLIDRINHYNEDDIVDLKGLTNKTVNVPDLPDPSDNSEDAENARKIRKNEQKRFRAFVGGSLGYIIIQTLKNIFTSDGRRYKQIINHYKTNSNTDDIITNEIVGIIFDFIQEKMNSKNASFVLDTILNEKNYIYENKVSLLDEFKTILSNKKYVEVVIRKYSDIKKYLKHFFKDQSNRRKIGSRDNSLIIWTLIAKEYVDDSYNALADLMRAVKDYNDTVDKKEKIYLRKTPGNIDQVEKTLQKVSNIPQIRVINSNYSAKGRNGRGEFLCHMLFNTANACLSIEPDVLIYTKGGEKLNYSVKSNKSGEARTGENMDQNVRNVFNIVVDTALSDLNIDDVSGLTTTQITNAKSKINNITIDINNIRRSFKRIDNYNHIKVDSFESLYNCLKVEITTEHNAVGIIHHDDRDNLKLIRKNNLTGREIKLTALSNNRFSFKFDMLNKSNISYENAFVDLMQALDVKMNQQVTATTTPNTPAQGTSTSNVKVNSAINAVTLNAGFKIKTSSNFLVEGGKAGHMMHPYENLHMKISDMKRMIEDFQNDFEISEKVDGANLFFTIDPQQGKILFSRNKSDMSHEETLEKFGPDHPAHVLFTDGANAIFNSAKNSLSKQDIQKVFGQSPEGGKTYINFEIMHPQKPNQIKYDMKYIVFHAIVDYDINGNVVESSPDDERLIHLLNQLQPSFNVANNDFSLGSNLKIKLNNLSQSDVDELLNELNSITTSLGLSDDMTIADAVKSEIRSLLDRENITELLPEDKIEMIYDFITNESTEVKGTAIKKGLDRELQKTLTSLGLTSKAKAYKIIKQIIQEFRPLFILLGIKLLHNVQSRYMSSDASNKNVDELRRLLDAAMEDYDNMMQAEDLSDVESKIVKTLTPHIANVRHHGVESVVSSPVEGGVFIGKDGNTYKVTGGFAPLNQILGTAMRSLDYMPVFKEEFIDQERGS